PPAEVVPDYLGLNHLGWLRALVHDGVDHLPRLLGDPARLAGTEEGRLFDPGFLARLGALPNEYLWYWYRTRQALAAVRPAGPPPGPGRGTGTSPPAVLDVVAPVTGLPAGSVVETVCDVDATGVNPRPLPPPTPHQLGLMAAVKATERAVVEAAFAADDVTRRA